MQFAQRNRLPFFAVALATFLFVVAVYVGQDTYGPVGEPTGKVWVFKSSEAARRGYALPGEGTSVYLAPGWPTLSLGLLAVAVVTYITAGGILVITNYKRQSIAASLKEDILPATVFGALIGWFGAYFLKNFLADPLVTVGGTAVLVFFVWWFAFRN